MQRHASQTYRGPAKALASVARWRTVAQPSSLALQHGLCRSRQVLCPLFQWGVDSSGQVLTDAPRSFLLPPCKMMAFERLVFSSLKLPLLSFQAGDFKIK